MAAYPVGCAIFSLGGFGFLSRKHGLSMDNVLSAEIVLADARVVRLHDKSSLDYAMLSDADRKEQDELWWALRGAGPLFGVITRIEARAIPIQTVYGADLI